jgi:hypothetical protein
MTRFRQVPIFRDLRGRNSLTLLLNAQKSCAASGRSRVMIADGRLRDLVVEFDRLWERQAVSVPDSTRQSNSG